jgi:hypothetical protein
MIGEKREDATHPSGGLRMLDEPLQRWVEISGLRQRNPKYVFWY